jgi:hypothetical protein
MPDNSVVVENPGLGVQRKRISTKACKGTMGKVGRHLLIASLLLSAVGTANAADQRQPISNETPVQIVEFRPTGQTAFALALQQSDSEVQSILRDAGDASISSSQVDLAGDGKPETILYLTGSLTCGARDCEVVIVRRIGDRNQIIFDENATSIAIGPIGPKGWKDLITNYASVDGQGTGVIWEWTGERYQIKK